MHIPVPQAKILISTVAWELENLCFLCFPAVLWMLVWGPHCAH